MKFSGYNQHDNIPEKLEFEAEQPLIELTRSRIHRKILESERTHGKFT